MRGSLQELLTDGATGDFWPYTSGMSVEQLQECWYGNVTKDGDWIRLELRELEPPAEASSETITGDLPTPDAFIGQINNRTLLFAELAAVGETRTFGSRGARTRVFLARTVFERVQVERLRSSRFTSLTASFNGVFRWAGSNAPNEVLEVDELGRATRLQVDLNHEEVKSAELADGTKLEIHKSWATGGPGWARTLYEVTRVTVRSEKPVPFHDLSVPLYRIQELLSLLHNGFVRPLSAEVTLDVSGPAPIEPVPGWNGMLMAPGPASLPPPDPVQPLITLEDMGGVDGLANWIDLSLQHHRAFQTFLGPYRHGEPLLESGVVAASSGIDNWVKAHWKLHHWASRPKGARDGQLLTERLAKHMAPSIREWVGDPAAWAKALRQASNTIKHDPKEELERQLLQDLAISGRLVLLAATLDSAAKTTVPSSKIFRLSRLAGLGARLQEHLPQAESDG